MKKQILMTMVLLVSSLLVGANAQTSQQHQLRTKIPFSFNVGEASLPAGEYTIVVVNPASDRKVLRVRSADGRLSALVQVTTLSGKEHDDAKVLFNRYGDQYVFASVELAGEGTSFAASKTKSERILQRDVGKTSQPRDVVAIRAR
jgi:hypothetical protein